MRSRDGIKWNTLRYHPVQSALWEYKGKYAAILAGRGSGKTLICRRILIREAGINRPWHNPLYYWVAPTIPQVKRTAWFPIIDEIPKHWLIPRFGINKSELSISLKNGAKIYFIGADKPHRMEGNQADFVFVDESSDQRPGLFEKSIRPMLTEKDGRCFRLGVPKRHGIGKKEFRDFYEKGLRGEGGIAAFHWKTIEVYTPETVEQLLREKDEMDPVTWEEQYEAQWKDVGGSVYYNFSDINIRDDLYYDPAREILVGCDFNVDPMSWTLSHYINGKFYVFDEICIRNTNTQATLDFLNNRYPNHLAGWRFYGDASAKSRKTSSTRSDYAIIKNDERFANKKVYFPKKNPHRRDRYASVNLAFCSAAKNVKLYIHIRCKKLINDLNMVSYIEGTTDIEDYSGTDIGHMADALGYKIYMIAPVKTQFEDAPVIYSTAG